MYRKGDYVNYSTQGICEIEDIQLIKFNSDSLARKYYILKPIHQKKACIYVPVDNQNLIDHMRPVLSSDEIDKVILSTKNHKIPWTKDRKQRTSEFQAILSRRDEKELLQLASCLYWKSKNDAKGLCSADRSLRLPAYRYAPCRKARGIYHCLIFHFFSSAYSPSSFITSS